MQEDIPAIPDVPAGLSDAARRGKLIPFIGAGVSKIAGCPNWSELAEQSLRYFIERDHFSHNQLDQIKNLHPRVKLSMALGLAEQHRTPIDFETLIQAPNWRNHAEGQKVYSELSRLGQTFITTNYDQWLDKEIVFPALSEEEPPGSIPNPVFNDRQVFYLRKDLTVDNLNKPNSVFHIHGSLQLPEEMILTTHDYITQYANDRSSDAAEENRLLTFLTHLFTHKTVLFVGYGLEDLEILEYVITKARTSRANKSEARHYMLQGYFSHEKQLMQSLKQYYLRECGIELIPFSRDQRDWKQLIPVLEKFARNAPASAPLRVQKMVEMEAMLNE